MKKLFIYASIVGLAVGVAYWLCKKGKTNNTAFEKENEKVDFESRHQEEETSHDSNIVAEMYQARSESAEAVYKRHSNASKIMKDVYSNIMEEFVEDFSSEKEANEKEKRKDDIIDGESVSVMKENDLISDALDDLLK